MNAFVYTNLCILALLGVRLGLVSRAHAKWIDEVYATNMALIDMRAEPQHDLYEVGDFHLDMLNLSKWTYAQHFPERAYEIAIARRA